jgi:hypothetical protein
MNPEVLNKKIESYVHALAVANDKVMTLEAEMEVVIPSMQRQIDELKQKLEQYESVNKDVVPEEGGPAQNDEAIAAEQLDEEENASR